MNTESNNFQENIHDEAYRQKYIKSEITHNDMIYDSGRSKESLNGLWNFCIDQYDSFLRAEWYKEELQDANGRDLPVDFSFDDWEKVMVPSCWNTEKPEYFYYEGSAVYTRTFKYVSQNEKMVYLKLGAVNYEAYIFLNKQIVGYHRGGSTPIYIDITNSVQKYNRLTVVVNNTRRREQVPANNTDWYNYGGLYRDVELLRLPEIFIKKFTIKLADGSDFKAVRASVALNADIDCTGALRLEELGVDIKIDIRAGLWSGDIACRPQLWSPENPKLYTVEVFCAEDSICEKVGFRQVRVIGTDIYLNGNKLFLKGISCHEESVPNGKSIRDEEIIENLKIAKDLNCNYIRLAHYPHTEKTARLADELGIMLWEEIPVYWAIDFENRDTLDDAKNQLIELIHRDINRASVIIWSVGNENADTEARLNFMKTLAELAKSEDPSRLVSAACLVDTAENKIKDRLAEYLDIIGINEYYGWYDPDFEKLPRCFGNSTISKPVVISEFGADARPNCRGTVDDLFTEDMQAHIYQKQIQTLRTVDYVKGMSPWILYDFRCPRRHNKYQQGYNLKGLLSCDKKHKKLAYSVLQKFYAEKF
jgi:Beta-galactosidase/beta-glucuronidase